MGTILPPSDGFLPEDPREDDPWSGNPGSGAGNLDLTSNSIARIIDLISEGVIGGLINEAQSIYFDEVPLQNSDGSYNFEGVTYKTRIGVEKQEPIKGFDDIESEIVVNKEVLWAFPVFFSLENENIDSIRIKFNLPRLLRYDPDTNQTYSSSVKLKIDFKSYTGDYVNLREHTIKGKTNSRYEEELELLIPKLESEDEGAGPTPWTIRVSRIDEEPDEDEKDNISNQIFVSNVTEIISVKMRYPHSALVALQFDAQSFGGSIPTRAYEVEGIKIRVPVNYDPINRTYTGIWNGQFKRAISDNPAWIMYDLLTNNRYGLGGYINNDEIDKWSLYDIGKYCDEFIDSGYGTLEPRFTINTAITKEYQAHDLIKLISSAFRGMAYWSVGSIFFSQDSPSTPAKLISPANVEGGQFNYQNSSLKTRHTIAYVSWNDPDNFFKPKVEPVEDQDSIKERGYNPIRVNAFGATTKGQAHRFGKWLLDTEKYENEVVTFIAGFDCVDLRPGRIIKISDPSIAGGRFGGRVASFDDGTNTLNVDNVVEIQGGDPDNWQHITNYVISVTLSDGSIDDITITNDPETTTALQLSRAPNGTIEVGAMFTIYADQIEPKTYRVVSVREIEKNKFEVTALFHDPLQYARVEENLQLESLPYSLWPTGDIVRVAEIDIREELYKLNNQLKIRTTVSWPPVSDPRVTVYKVFGYAPNGAKIQLHIGSTTSFEIEDTQKGDWTFEILAMANAAANQAGFSRVIFRNISITGRTDLPPNVKNFRATRRPDGVYLEWDIVPDVDVIGYNIRRGESYGSGEVVVDNHVGTAMFVTLGTPENVKFHIRAIDAFGKESQIPGYVETSVIPPEVVKNFTIFQEGEKVKAVWDAVDGAQDYDLRFGDEWEASQKLFITDSTEAILTFPARQDSTKSFLIKARNSAGLYSDAVSTWKANLLALPNRNVLIQQDEKAGPWTGFKNNMQVIAGDILAVNQAASGSTMRYGEYIFDVNLPYLARARNWLEHTIGTVFGAGFSWDDAIFSWDVDEANIPWLGTGDVDGVRIIPHIAIKEPSSGGQELIDSFRKNDKINALIDGFRLNNTLTGHKGATPSSSAGISYAHARYADGLAVNDLTELEYSLAIPSSFSALFTYRITEFFEGKMIYAILLGTSGNLELGFDFSKNECFLRKTDHTEIMKVGVELKFNQYIIMGVSQNPTIRRLFVNDVALDEQHSSEEEFASLGTFQTVKLA